jgi:general secretion pathway protein A
MLAALFYGIKERRGFITIVGEVGTGKTTLINTVLSRLDQKTKVAYIFNTDVTYAQLLTMTLVELGLAKSDDSLKKVEAVNRLNKFAIRQLAGGHNVVLIVDEAQNLNLRSMENLRLLSNLETRKHKLIQIVLSGQPELDVKLSQPELRQLAQRISLKRYIIPLSEKETYEYIQHRLRVANYKGPPLFSRRAQELIWEYSKGVPRKINILCDNALLIGYAGGKKRVKENVVEEAVNDLTWSPFSGDVRARELESFFGGC